MQIVHTPSGDPVAVMSSTELLITEVALSRYVLENPDSNRAVRMLSGVSRANEETEARMDEAAESAASPAD